MRDGFQSVFDLVEATFWREDGRLYMMVSCVVVAALLR